MEARHLLEYWDELKTDLACRSLYLFLDFDGTLSPIVRDPGQAVLSLRMRRRMEKLLSTGWCRIAVISGRTLEDIRRRIGIAGITYAGNHGLEIEGPKVKFRYPIPRTARSALDDVRRVLGKTLFAVPGVFLEDKGATLTVHLRKVKHGELRMVEYAVSEATRPYRIQEGVVVRPGKETFEIRPSVEWNKGKTVLWLLEKGAVADGEPPWPLFVGDDRTDEDAFQAIRARGATVYVGPPRQTTALYYLRNVGEVAEFLGRLGRIRKR